MTYCRNNPAVATVNTSLIVAGGWETSGERKTEVEVMNTHTLQWSTVANLPYPLSEATATICGHRLYLGGGLSSFGMATKSVLECEVEDLIKTQPPSLASRLGLSRSHKVWREVASLPVRGSSLVTFQGHLLAVGGAAGAGPTPDVRQYDAATNSWNVTSQMRVRRCWCLAMVLSNNTLMVAGGFGSDQCTSSVETAST